jgi:hypothetical protein
MTDKPKKKDVRTLFVERMKREGREKEWLAAIRGVRERTGKKHGQCVFEAMKLLGYEGPEKEREYEAAYSAKLVEHVPASDSNLMEIRERLPDRAPYEAEINWILSNKAMFRRARNRTKAEDVIVTLAEVLGPPKCPSKAALTMLQICVNQPSEFVKRYLESMKKSATDDKGASVEEVADPSLDEITQMLEEVAAG